MVPLEEDFSAARRLSLPFFFSFAVFSQVETVIYRQPRSLGVVASSVV